MKKIIFLYFFAITLQAQAQPKTYSCQNAHSHNDYQNNIPFSRAYQQDFGSIEVDVFPVNGNLLVGHNEKELNANKTFHNLYWQALVEHIKLDKNRKVNLVIDIKENYFTTIEILAKQIEKDLSWVKSSSNPNGQIQIVISGTLPKIEQLKDAPAYIYFDLNWTNQSLDEQTLSKIASFSSSFKKYSDWNGKGLIVAKEQIKIKNIVDSVHYYHKPIRFWATPDTKSAWIALMKFGVDFINTDDIDGFGNFVSQLNNNRHVHTTETPVYHPKYLNDGKKTKIKNIIFLIGDGMGLAQTYASYTANRGALNLYQMKHIGFSITYSADSYITDSSAGGTAMACGEKTNNRANGVTPDNKPLKSLATIAAELNKKTSIITVGNLTDATPAAFYAHQIDRDMQTEIANDMENSKINILVGSGQSHFTPIYKGSSAIEKLHKKNYQVVFNFEDFLKSTSDKIVAIVPEDDTKSKNAGRGDFLSQSFQKVIKAHQTNPNGFFMMLEAAQIDFGGHFNNLSYIVNENLDFDKVIGEALKFADIDGETLVIVTADHETSGLSLLDGSIENKEILANFATKDHSGIPVPVYAYGPHANEFIGVYQNTEIFKKIVRLMKSN